MTEEEFHAATEPEMRILALDLMEALKTADVIKPGVEPFALEGGPTLGLSEILVAGLQAARAHGFTIFKHSEAGHD